MTWVSVFCFGLAAVCFFDLVVLSLHGGGE